MPKRKQAKDEEDSKQVNKNKNNNNSNNKNDTHKKKRTTTKTPLSKKRTAPTATSASSKIRTPPKSLVRLLQTDSKVLEYFTWLQENLQENVSKWKTRAMTFQQESISLQDQLQQQTLQLQQQQTLQLQQQQQETHQSRRRCNDDDDVKKTNKTRNRGKMAQGSSSYSDPHAKTTTLKEKDSSQSEGLMASQKLMTLTKNNDDGDDNNNDDDQKDEEEMNDESLGMAMLDDLSSDDDDDLDLDIKNSKNHCGDDDKSDKLQQQQQQQQTSASKSHFQFDLSSSDDDDNDDNDDDYDAIEKKLDHQVFKVQNHLEDQKHDDSSEQQHQQHDQLSVEHVQPQQQQKQQYYDDDDDDNNDVSLLETSLYQLGVALQDDDGKRRSDVDVLTDLWQGLRAVVNTTASLLVRENTTATSTLQEAYYSILGDLYQSDYNKNTNKSFLYYHQALEHAKTILRILDLYENEAFMKSTMEDDVLEQRMGMRDRQSMITNWMQSVRGEITEVWPVADRTARLVSTAVHYYDDATDETTDTTAALENNATVTAKKVGPKSQSRMSMILERSLLVQLLVYYYDYRDESVKRIHLLCSYVHATAPSSHVEEYPKYPPVLSMCIVEAMLGTQMDVDIFKTSNENLPLLHGCGLAIHMTAKIWEQRIQSQDDRISDIAKVQMASYKRILRLDYSWLLSSKLDDISAFDKEMNQALEKNDFFTASLITILDEASNAHLIEAIPNTNDPNERLSKIFVRCIGMRHMEVLQLDKFRSEIGTPQKMDASYQQVLDVLKEINTAQPDCSEQVCSTLAKCYLHLSNGNCVYELARTAVDSVHPDDTAVSAVGYNISLWQQSWMMHLSQTPLVRVINLRRRLDRRKAFDAQIKVEKLLVVNAVASTQATDKNKNPSYYWGEYAFDGRSLDTTIDTGLVGTHWRPSDLRAFDKDAPSDESPVKMSPSERACALSHIYSWIGVARSLELPPISAMPTHPLRHPNHVLRLFRISGFASGKALLAEHESMPPAPVCVILEDDAILVDRFVDRLREVLEELPRDFHFCSLGYSRPKTAPVLPYSAHVGIPTCTWYLTGYVLSLEGAKYLETKLPVVGPIDSWIGLRMCANWENSYGLSLGVGMQSKPMTELPPRKELGALLGFRAFCALTPLCSQRVGNSSGVGRSWRQRDTDIVYSGHSAGSFRPKFSR